MLVKQQETQRQIQNAETEKQLQQTLGQVTEISKALEEIRLWYQNQVSMSAVFRWCCDAYVEGKHFNLLHNVYPVSLIYLIS